MSIDYLERIPNNVDLASNRTLQRALWNNGSRSFLNWWRELGPSHFNVRRRLSAHRRYPSTNKGWASFGGM